VQFLIFLNQTLLGQQILRRTVSLYSRSSTGVLLGFTRICLFLIIFPLSSCLIYPKAYNFFLRLLVNKDAELLPSSDNISSVTVFHRKYVSF